MSEYLFSSPVVNFEPGAHPTEQSEQNKVFNQTLNGEVDAHVWNGNIRHRIHAYKPALIAVDSVEPIGVGDSRKIGIIDKAFIWSAMPGRPSQLNGKDEILVIAGDNTYGESDSNGFPATQIRMLNIALAIGATAKVAAFASDHLVVQKTKQQKPRIYDQEASDTSVLKNSGVLTRRQLMGLSGGLVAFSLLNAHSLASYSPWAFSKDIAVDIDTGAESVSLERAANIDHGYDYVTGRTALLIAKTLDVASLLGGEVYDRGGAVVMGDAHSFHANDLLDDYAMRSERIRRHTELMLEKAKSSMDTFTGKWTPRERQKWVMDNQSHLQLFRVLEPDAKRFKKDPKAEIDRIVRFEQTMVSPSVAGAIDGLL